MGLRVANTGREMDKNILEKLNSVISSMKNFHVIAIIIIIIIIIISVGTVVVGRRAAAVAFLALLQVATAAKLLHTLR